MAVYLNFLKLVWFWCCLQEDQTPEYSAFEHRHLLVIPYGASKPSFWGCGLHYWLLFLSFYLHLSSQWFSTFKPLGAHCRSIQPLIIQGNLTNPLWENYFKNSYIHVHTYILLQYTNTALNTVECDEVDIMCIATLTKLKWLEMFLRVQNGNMWSTQNIEYAFNIPNLMNIIATPLLH